MIEHAPGEGAQRTTTLQRKIDVFARLWSF